jgi:CubicO group peptidase (beta-lactamase class C family)
MSDDERRAARLERLARQVQARERIPALQVAVQRADRPLWTFEVGTSGRAEAPLGPGSRLRMGSITKTFTATLVLQCRDEGLLDLDDPVSRFLDLPAHGELTVRRLLSHTSGLQREPYGDVWDTLRMPAVDRVLAELDRVERVLPTARRYHYSNLGLAILGQVVARLRGAAWEDVLAERILRPLGLTGTGLLPGDQGVVGYLVDAWSDHVRAEPATELDGVAPAGQLWSTATDLARWAAFLADPSTVDPAASVLKASTVEEMRWPLTVTDEANWASGFGLGLILVPRPDRVLHVGHDGAMPGFIASAYGRFGPDQPAAFAAAALGSSGTAVAIGELVQTLLAVDAAEFPPPIAPWTPGEPAPADLRSVLGRWWSEGFEYIFSWRDGALHARRVQDAVHKPPSVFEPLPATADELRTLAGGEAGERLRLERDPAAGVVIRMRWATYRFTRTQEAFDGGSPTEP